MSQSNGDDGANVVRELLLAPGGTVDAHSHSLTQVVAPRTGLLAVTTPAATWMIAGPSRAIIIPAAVEHSHRAHVRCEVTTLLLGAASAATPDCPDQPAAVMLTPLAQNILRALDDNSRRREQRQALECALQHEVFDLQWRRQGGPALPTPRDPRLLTMFDLMIRCPEHRHDLGTLARRVGATERTLQRLISSELAVTFTQWRTLIRVIVSLGFLADGKSVTATAHRSGFTSTSAYIAAFRRVMHQTPGAYAAAENPR
ncbi:MAG: AraC family transcriptional regulator [Mycobacterium sp.]